MRLLVLCLLLSLVAADRGQTCTCTYEFPETGGAYAVAECTLDILTGNFTKPCQCPDVSNPLLNNVTTPCPGKTVLTGVSGFTYNTRTMCTRLVPAEVTQKPVYLVECEGSACGGASKGLRSYITAVERTLNQSVPRCSFTTRTEECFDNSTCELACKVSAWSPWTGCSRTCGSDAVRTRTREILKVPLGLVAEDDCPPLVETMSCSSFLSSCNVTETWNATAHTRNCSSDEFTLSTASTTNSCRVFCVDETIYQECSLQKWNTSTSEWQKTNFDSDLYRRCGVHALAWNSSLCACASQIHVASFSGLPCNGIRTQCDADDYFLPYNLSKTWQNSCQVRQSLQGLISSNVFNRKREFDYTCRSNETCPSLLPAAGVRVCANASEKYATCGHTNATDCYISCWTPSDCRGISSLCTCPLGTDFTSVKPCFNTSYTRNCTDTESAPCDGCVSFSSPGVCSMGTQCMVNCSTETQRCNVIPSTCGNDTIRVVECPDSDRVRYCGESAIACNMEVEDNVALGITTKFPSTVQCFCGSRNVPIPLLASSNANDQFEYGVPCASAETLVQSCSAAQTREWCGVSMGGEPSSLLQWDVRYCLQRQGQLVPYTCPDTYDVRECTPDEFYRNCPLAQHSGCRVACPRGTSCFSPCLSLACSHFCCDDVGDTSVACRRFGKCSEIRNCTIDDALAYCGRFGTSCTIETRDEPFMGRRSYVNDTTCGYVCQDPWYGDKCQYNFNDGPCSAERYLWFCGVPWQVSSCTSLNVTTVICQCRTNYSNPIALPPGSNTTIAAASLQLLPYCSGKKRACTEDEVVQYTGPYGQNCSLYCHEVLTMDCALGPYACQPNGFPLQVEGVIQNSTSTYGPLILPCGTNKRLISNYSDPSFVQDVCGRGGAKVDVIAEYGSAGTVVNYEIVNGTCQCIPGYYASGHIPCQTYYYTRECTESERALVPLELWRDCPAYACRLLCYPPRGTAPELCFAHESSPCLDNHLQPYWTVVRNTSFALQKCGAYLELALASCSFASDLKFTARCTGQVECHCRTDVSMALAFSDTSALSDGQLPCDAKYTVRKAVNQWEAIYACKSALTLNATVRVYSDVRPVEAHNCTCHPQFVDKTSVRRCASNITGEICESPGASTVPGNCGPLSYGVDYTCDSSNTCSPQCKCLPGGNDIEFFAGQKCSGYRRNCSMDERAQYCPSAEYFCLVDCASYHVAGYTKLPCRFVNDSCLYKGDPVYNATFQPVMGVTVDVQLLINGTTTLPLTDFSTIPAGMYHYNTPDYFDIIHRDCGPSGFVCNMFIQNRTCAWGSCICDTAVGARYCSSQRLPYATINQTTLTKQCGPGAQTCIWRPFNQTCVPGSCRCKPYPAGVRSQGWCEVPTGIFRDCNDTRPWYNTTAASAPRTLAQAIRATCGANSRQCRVRRFLVPYIISLLYKFGNEVSAVSGFKLNYSWLVTYLRMAMDPTTGQPKRVYVDPSFQCSVSMAAGMATSLDCYRIPRSTSSTRVTFTATQRYATAHERYSDFTVRAKPTWPYTTPMTYADNLRALFPFVTHPDDEAWRVPAYVSSTTEIPDWGALYQCAVGDECRTTITTYYYCGTIHTAQGFVNTTCSSISKKWLLPYPYPEPRQAASNASKWNPAVHGLPFSFTPFQGQSADDPLDYEIWIPECFCGPHPYIFSEMLGKWYTYWEPGALDPLSQVQLGGYNSSKDFFIDSFMANLQCTNRFFAFETAQGTCNREPRSQLTCNGVGHCRSWRHATFPLCKEYQNMFKFCLEERLLRTIYTANEYRALNYRPSPQFDPSRIIEQAQTGIDIVLSRGGFDYNAAVAWGDWNGTYITSPTATTAEQIRDGFTTAFSNTVWRAIGCGLATMDCASYMPEPLGVSVAFGQASTIDSSGCAPFVKALLNDELDTASTIPDNCTAALLAVQRLPWTFGTQLYNNSVGLYNDSIGLQSAASQGYIRVGQQCFQRPAAGGNGYYEDCLLDVQVADTSVFENARLSYREGLDERFTGQVLAQITNLENAYSWGSVGCAIATCQNNQCEAATPQTAKCWTPGLTIGMYELQQLLKNSDRCRSDDFDRTQGVAYIDCRGYTAVLTLPDGRVVTKRFLAPAFLDVIQGTTSTKGLSLQSFKCGSQYYRVINCAVFSNYTGSCVNAFQWSQLFYRVVYTTAEELEFKSERLNGIGNGFINQQYFTRLDDISRTVADFGTRDKSAQSLCANVPCNCRIEAFTGLDCGTRNCRPGSGNVCLLGFRGLCEDEPNFVGQEYLKNNSWDGLYIARQCCHGEKCTLPLGWNGRVGCVNGFYDWSAAKCRCDAGWTSNGGLPIGSCTVSQCTGDTAGCLNGGVCNANTLKCQCPETHFGPNCQKLVEIYACGVGGCGLKGKCVLVNETAGECRCASSQYSPTLANPTRPCPDPPKTGNWKLDPNPPPGTCRYLDQTVFIYGTEPDVTGAFPCDKFECYVNGSCACINSYTPGGSTSHLLRRRGGRRHDVVVRPYGATAVEREQLCPKSAFPYPFQRDETLFYAATPVCAAIIKLSWYPTNTLFYEWRAPFCSTPWAPCLNGGVPTHENTTADPFRVVCKCPDPYVGQFCEWNACPQSRNNVTCSGYAKSGCTRLNRDCRVYDSSTNGLRCNRTSGGIDYGVQGCGCSHDLRPECQQPGSSSICSGAIRYVNSTKRIDVCVPYINGAAGQVSYRCECPDDKSGTYCETNRCPIPGHLTGLVSDTCNGRRCTLNGTCACDNHLQQLPDGRLLTGSTCEFDVTLQCGYTPPTTTSLLVCAGHGTCTYNASITQFQCKCLSGYTGEFCQRSLCSAGTCQFGDCVATGSGGLESTCQCWNVDVYKKSSPTSACNISDCGLAFPNPAGDKCVCTNTSLSPPDCTQNLCPRVSPGNQLCGQTAPGDVFDVNSRALYDGARETMGKQCSTEGICVCNWRYTYDNATNTCIPRCNVSNALDAYLETDAFGGLPRENGVPVLRFGGCICKDAYSPASNCSTFLCQHGSSEVNDDGSCVCLPAWKGRYCETSRCAGRGTVRNTTNAVCDCNPPFNGTFCEDEDPNYLKCENNGTLVNSSVCSCPFPWTGRSCLGHLCQHSGIPVGTGCQCTSFWTGTSCQTRVCKNNGKLDVGSNICSCAFQYTGDSCESRFCGLYGQRVFTGVTSQCFCPGIWSLDANGNCTQSTCVNGYPKGATEQVCQCNPPYIDRGSAFPNHRCRLECSSYGNYSELTSACICDDEHFGLLCELAIVTAIQKNATTGLTHDVPLTSLVNTTTVTNPSSSSVGSSILDQVFDSEDNTTSTRPMPLPTTSAEPNTTLPETPTDTPNITGVSNTTTGAESFLLSTTAVGVASAVGGGVLFTLISVIAAVV